MTTSPITDDELSRLAGAHASALIDSATDPGLSEEINLRLLNEFQATWQPSLSDKEYTALYKTYTSWLLTDLKNHSNPGSSIRIQRISPEQIEDGSEIHRPDRAPMLTPKWLELVRRTHDISKDAAKKIAATTMSGGDGTKELENQFHAFLRILSKDPPNEEETDEIIRIFYSQTNIALAHELETKNDAAPPKKSSGCLGIVALFMLTPLALLISWSYA